MNSMQNFADTLTELMLNNELSPKQLAGEISVSEKTIYV